LALQLGWSTAFLIGLSPDAVPAAAREQRPRASSPARGPSLPSRAILPPIDSCPQSDMIGGLYWVSLFGTHAVLSSCGPLDPWELEAW